MTSAENAFAVGLFRDLPGRYDRLAEVLSLGQNALWRAELVGHIAGAEPRQVLDVATGTAGVALAIASRTAADIVGVDISDDMLEVGRRRVAAAGLDSRIRLQAGRAEQLLFDDGSFDAISFTYLLRYVSDPAATITELARTLRPGGVMASLDFYVPPNPFWRALWWCYTRIGLPVAGWLLGGKPWWDVGRFLGPNISGHYQRFPLARIVDLWTGAGMTEVQWRVMSVGGGLVMWGTKGSDA